MSEFSKVIKVFQVYRPIVAKYEKFGYWTAIMYCFGVISASIISPYIFKLLIDEIVQLKGELIWYYFGIYALNIVVYRIIFYIADRLLFFYQSKSMTEVAVAAFKNLSERSYNFYTNEFAGSIVAKANRFVNSFADLHSQLSFNLAPGFVTVIGIIIVVAIENLFLGLIFLVWTILHLAMSMFLIKNKVVLAEAVAGEQSKTTAVLADFLTNSLTALSFGSAKREQFLYKDQVLRYEDARDRDWGYLIKIFILLTSSVSFISIVTIGASIYLWQLNAVTTGTIVLLFAYLGNLFMTMMTITRSIERSTTLFADAIEMAEILNRPNEIVDHSSAIELQVEKGEIEFENVSFNYTDAGRNEIDDFNLHIKAGESVGLVGHSGAGKSTIIKLLLRFVDINGGTIKIDGQDISKVTQESLRQAISYIPQEPLLFHRSLAENIAYGKPDASLEEIITAAKQAQAHEFITGLEKGYETLVGERGIKLSGGQRQRIAIARAILKDSKILILDEATSSLDSKAEREIQIAIHNLIQGTDSDKGKSKTVIAIAHRLSTIKDMDRVVVIEDGRVVETGTHQELLKCEGIYCDLWNHQHGGFID